MSLALANERNESPNDQPCKEVHCWRLVRSPGGTDNLVTLWDGGTARVMSPIAWIGHQARVFTTSSGLRYVVRVSPEVAELECRAL